MDMEQDGTSKKVSSLLEKKDAASDDLNATRKEAEEINSTVSGIAETVLMRYIYIICIPFLQVALTC